MGNTVVRPSAPVINFACPVQFSEETLKAAAHRENNPSLNNMYDSDKSIPKEVRQADMPADEVLEFSRKLAVKKAFELHKNVHKTKENFAHSVKKFVSPESHRQRATTERPIRVGTDCSGMEAHIQALMNLKVPFQHVFSCENDEHARATIKANFKPDKLYQDITKRDNSDSSVGRVDVYIAGFPCQSFSKLGKQKGFDDRGQIFYNVLDYIKQKRPKIFILENVKGLVTLDNGKHLETILRALKSVGRPKDSEQGANPSGIYEIHHQVLNTNENGIPQHRPRWYCVGIRKGSFKESTSFEFPDKFKCPPIEDFLTPKPI